MFTEFYVKTKLALESYKNDERGVTAIEYGLIAAAIAVVILGAVNQVGKDLVELFGDISSALTDRTTAGQDVE
ncbi:Flp family type IVb pilin [Vibrio sp. B172a]|uniref:Flp family type IVb pilin n=1 Tax=Vibrio sp. B172a TaxID=2835790 RepID=UPI0025539F52|nr:Flp family type IVb pilin [Vibrio sp. B172a]MDK9783499.1 Flp family type IVb pilin [Vibrio sp. B172a]